jgi:hypothetical protein
MNDAYNTMYDVYNTMNEKESLYAHIYNSKLDNIPLTLFRNVDMGILNDYKIQLLNCILSIIDHVECNI